MISNKQTHKHSRAKRLNGCHKRHYGDDEPMRKTCYGPAMGFPKFIGLAIIIGLISTPASAQKPNNYILAAPLLMQEGDNIAWSEPDFDAHSWSIVSLSSKSSLFVDIPFPSGVAWLRSIPFEVPQSFKNGPVAIYIETGVPYEIYWNGVLLGANGRPAADVTDEATGVVNARFYVPPDLIRPEGNVLAIRFSAHNLARLPLPLRLSAMVGPFEDDRYRLFVRIVPGLLLIGAVGAAAVFFSALFVSRPSDRGSLWLALMFAVVTLQSGAEISKALLSDFYYLELVRYFVIFLASYASGLFLLLFVLTFFDFDRFKLKALIAAHLAIGAVFVFFFGVERLSFFGLDRLNFAFSVIFVTISIGFTSWSLYKKREGALPLLIALSVVGVSFTAGYSAFVDRYYFITMAVLAGVLFVLQAGAFRRAERRSLEARNQRDQAELVLLKQQIQPHFMMNTLTALSEWILTSPESSVDMIDALADELRILNGYSGEALIPLSSELDLCRSHLKVMSYRQNQTFTLDTQIENQNIVVPPAIFHTLIENALTHNRYATKASVFQFQQTKTASGILEFKLTTPPSLGQNNARGSSSCNSGVGLAYVRARLEQAYGAQFTMEDGATPEGGWFTTIRLSKGAIS